MIVEKDFYEILGISHLASQEQIRDKYRLLVKQYHPDLHPKDVGAAEKMEQVNSAYDIIGNSEERKQYDEQLEMETWQVMSDQEKARVEEVEEEEEDWEKERSQERNNGNLFGDFWVPVPEKPLNELTGWALFGRVVLLAFKIIFSLLFILLRFLNTEVDE